MPSPATLPSSSTPAISCCPAAGVAAGTLGVPGYGLVLRAHNPVPGTGHSRVVTALTSV